MVPSTPMSAAARVCSMVSRVFSDVVPPKNGTRPFTVSTTVAMNAFFSDQVSVAPSPKVPRLIRPSMPDWISASTTRAVSSRSTVSWARQSLALSFAGVGMIAHAPWMSEAWRRCR